MEMFWATFKKSIHTSLAVPLRFYAPVALEVNFSSGSTFWVLFRA